MGRASGSGRDPSGSEGDDCVSEAYLARMEKIGEDDDIELIPVQQVGVIPVGCD